MSGQGIRPGNKFRVSGQDIRPGNKFRGEWMGRLRSLYRHSRVSGNPAVTCQDCGIIRQYRRDSRLRGNDGGGRREGR